MPNLLQTLRDTYLTNPAAALNMLPELFRAEEDRLIVELPCKVGDKVYVIAKCGEIMMHQDNDYLTGTGEITCPFENACNFEECDDENIQIIETECGGFTLDAGKWFVWLANISRDILVSDFGKTVFLTREAAEKRLEGEKK